MLSSLGPLVDLVQQQREHALRKPALTLNRCLQPLVALLLVLCEHCFQIQLFVKGLDLRNGRVIVFAVIFLS